MRISAAGLVCLIVGSTPLLAQDGGGPLSAIDWLSQSVATPVGQGTGGIAVAIDEPPVTDQGAFSARLASFHQLDLRVDKTWTFEAWRLTAYLDIRNTYNRQNAEGVSYNFDYSESAPQAGLPLLPVIGLRGEL